MNYTDKLVLVADDELHLTHIVRFKLEQAGLQVITANDGQEALKLALAHQPHLIVTDYQMPVMDGYELCVQLREHSVTMHTPVLMLTARGHKLSPSQLARTNIAYLMAKPFSAHELMEKTQELLLSSDISDQEDHAPVAAHERIDPDTAAA